MAWTIRPLVGILLRAIGAIVLAAAIMVFHHLAAIGPNHTGHEPSGIYALALLAFSALSAGGALLFYGHHLFDRVQVSELWAPPATTYEPLSAGK